MTGGPQKFISPPATGEKPMGQELQRSDKILTNGPPSPKVEIFPMFFFGGFLLGKMLEQKNCGFNDDFIPWQNKSKFSEDFCC